MGLRTCTYRPPPVLRRYSPNTIAERRQPPCSTPAVAATDAANTSYIQWIYVGAGVTTRTWTVKMPAAAGTYEFRYFPGGGYRRGATSPPVTVTASVPPSLAVSTQSVNGGAAVTVTLTNGFGGAYEVKSEK